MSDAGDLTNRLRPFGDDLVEWRQAAASLRTKVQEAVDAKSVDAETLTATEQSADKIYEAIDRFDALKSVVAETSPRAAEQLAGVGEAMRLVLLEMTELTTRLYSVRSIPQSEDPKPEHSLSQEGDAEPESDAPGDPGALPLSGKRRSLK